MEEIKTVPETSIFMRFWYCFFYIAENPVGIFKTEVFLDCKNNQKLFSNIVKISENSK